MILGVRSISVGVHSIHRQQISGLASLHNKAPRHNDKESKVQKDNKSEERKEPKKPKPENLQILIKNITIDCATLLTIHSITLPTCNIGYSIHTIGHSARSGITKQPKRKC